MNTLLQFLAKVQILYSILYYSLEEYIPPDKVLPNSHGKVQRWLFLGIPINALIALESRMGYMCHRIPQ